MEKDRFISIIQEHQKIIYKICRTYCKNPENRKDLEQEICIQLWNSFRKFDERVKISTWMYRIALNTAITFYRNDCKVNRRKVPLDTSLIMLADDTEENAELEHRALLLYQFIDRLNALEKAIMLLYLDNNSYRDISEVLGITETNVGTKIGRIKNTLKEQFNHEGG